MGLMDTLRHAEQQGERAAHRGAELVRAGLHQAEGSFHRKSKAKSRGKSANANLPVSSHIDPQQESGRPPAAKARTGIVSVNGQDVGKIHCTGH